MIEIIIPAYNCHKTLRRALSSLEAQIDDKFIVTLVDDCSLISLKDIVDTYADSLNIEYIRNEKNLGCGMSRQVGVDNSNADYIMFLDADDILMPYAVKTFNDAIEQKPEADMFTCSFYTCENGKMRTTADKTHCHGKLYKKSFLNKYKIQASPLIKYADDSYFNSQCFTLAESIIALKTPIYIWMRNKDSVTLSKDYREHCISDFTRAMKLSVLKILQYLPLNKITFIDGVMKNITNMYRERKPYLTHKEKLAIHEELNAFKKLINRDIDVEL